MHSWRAALLATAAWLAVDTRAGYAQTYITNYQVISSPNQFASPIYLQGGQLSAAASLASIAGAINVDDNQSGTLSAQNGGSVGINIDRLGRNAVLHLGSASEQGTIVINGFVSNAVSSPPSLYIDGGYVRAGSSQFGAAPSTFAGTTVAANAVLDFNVYAGVSATFRERVRSEASLPRSPWTVATMPAASSARACSNSMEPQSGAGPRAASEPIM